MLFEERVPRKRGNGVLREDIPEAPRNSSPKVFACWKNQIKINFVHTENVQCYYNQK